MTYITSGISEVSSSPANFSVADTSVPTILIVDNDVNGRKFIHTVLSKCGYRTLLAGSGSEALTHASDGKIDLLLTDLVMPKMTGPELASAMQTLYPNLKHIFMSGFTEAAALKFGYMPEAPFLEKPISSNVLRRKIAEVLAAPITGAVALSVNPR